jgi:hypothetical protein
VILRYVLPTGGSPSAASKYKNYCAMTATRSQSVPRNTSGNHCRVARILATSDGSCPDLGTTLWTKLLSILPVGVTMCDGRGACIYKNAKAREYFPGKGDEALRVLLKLRLLSALQQLPAPTCSAPHMIVPHASCSDSHAQD